MASLLPDPKDDHVLELAVASGAKLIMTHNTKDFLGVEEFGIRPITPKEILEEVL
jgi:predicted nucleic acid-binding protein